MELASESEPGEGSGGSYVYGTECYLAHVARCIEVDGWYSRKKAMVVECPATADDAWHRMAGNPPKSWHVEEMKRWRELAPTDESRETAKVALAWAREQPGHMGERCSDTWVTH